MYCPLMSWLPVIAYHSQANICDTGQDIAFHAVTNAHMQAVAGLQIDTCNGEIVLVVADTLPLADAFLVDESAVQRVCQHTMLRLYRLFHNEIKAHKGVSPIDSQS